MKKILVIFTFCLLLIGCQDNQEVYHIILQSNNEIICEYNSFENDLIKDVNIDYCDEKYCFKLKEWKLDYNKNNEYVYEAVFIKELINKLYTIQLKNHLDEVIETYTSYDTDRFPDLELDYKDDEYNYVFKEWTLFSNENNTLIYKPVFTKERINTLFTVNLLDYNDEVIITYQSNDLSKFPLVNVNYQDNQFNYVFKEWILINNTDNTYTYKPLFIKEERIYKISFDGNSGKLISGDEEQYLKYESMPKEVIFEKEMYQFIGFDKEINKVTEDTTYIAQYEKLTINKISAFEFVKDITTGFNLVNCVNDTEYDLNKLFLLLKEYGFNSIQLPMNWCDYCNEEYVIDNKVLERVKYIVDIAIDFDMYVILTSYDSYELAWSSLNYYQYEEALRITNLIWTQIGEYFIEYDEHVLFSYLGEPRDYISNTYTREGAMILNLLNENFIKIIREQGFNNKYRQLLITSVWGSSGSENTRYLKFFDDDYLILNFHAYTPFGFAHDSTYDEISFTENEAKYQIELMELFKDINDKYIVNGIPVLITEFSARDKNNTEERAKWLRFYLSLAYNYGIKCFCWDCAIIQYDRDFSFGWINKNTCQWKYEEIGNVYKDIFINNNVMPFYQEVYCSDEVINQEIIIPEKFTNLLTGELERGTVIYDYSKITKKEGLYYGNQLGEAIFEINIKGNKYYFSKNIVTEYDLYECSFSLETRLNEDRIQCFILTDKFSKMRVDYDWYSSNEDIFTISIYSTITINKDGVAAIIARNKETEEIGVLEITIENGIIVKSRNIFIEDTY